MGALWPALRTHEYRVILIHPRSHRVLANVTAGCVRLPRVNISSTARPARELQTAIRTTWNITAFILDLYATPHGTSPYAVAAVLSSRLNSNFEEVGLDQIPISELTAEERHACATLLEGERLTPLAGAGWIDEALGWIASETGRSFSAENIEQLNAGGGFALMPLRSDNGRIFWLKSTGVPNIHELSMTSCLSDIFPEFLPKLVAIKSDWNAWLTEDAGEPLSNSFTDAALVSAVRRFASLQIQTTGCIDMLLAAGAFDQRIPVLMRHLDHAISFLIDAMARQTTTKVAPLSPRRVFELGRIMRDALYQMQSLGIPDALLHNDLNLGNILGGETRCVFTDWSEAAVGNPFLSFERLRIISRDTESTLRRAYGEIWRDWISQANMDIAFRLAQPLSILACLYGRGNWLREPETITPQFESYARSLARHLDRITRASALEGDLCR